MKTWILSLFFISSISAFATNVTIQPGSSTTIAAGDTVTVSCEGNGGGRHYDDSCKCQIRDTGCSGDKKESYVTLGGSELWREGYCRTGEEALRLCRTKLAELKSNGTCL